MDLSITSCDVVDLSTQGFCSGGVAAGAVLLPTNKLGYSFELAISRLS